jgi:hypothetical protein
MRHIPPRDVVSRLPEDCHLLSRVYEVDLCRIGGCDPFIRLRLLFMGKTGEGGTSRWPGE